MKFFSKRIIWLTVFLAFSEVAMAGVITDAPRISEILLKVLNFMLYISGTIAIIMLVGSGIMYIISAGDERATEKAKDAAKNSAAGIFFVLVSLAVVKIIAMIIGE